MRISPFDPKEATPLLIAIKKARVSHRIWRLHLQHKARLLRVLEGHPANPHVFAYGRLRNFEHLAMEHMWKKLVSKRQDRVGNKTG